MVREVVGAGAEGGCGGGNDSMWEVGKLKFENVCVLVFFLLLLYSGIVRKFVAEPMGVSSFFRGLPNSNDTGVG